LIPVPAETTCQPLLDDACAMPLYLHSWIYDSCHRP
jgi:hypothetical protein